MKQLAVLPDIRAVVREEDRDVADQRHPALVTIRAQLTPLPLEQPLLEDTELDLVRQLTGRSSQGRGHAVAILGLPARPFALAVLALERAEQCVVFEPAAVSFAKRCELWISAAGFERAAQTRRAKAFGGGVVDALCRELVRTGQRCVGQQSRADQRLERDQQRVAGER